MTTVINVENANCVAEIDLDFDCNNLETCDLYVGKRNTGWQLGICNCVKNGYVQAQQAAIYSYDCCECKKIKKLISYDNIKIS